MAKTKKEIPFFIDKLFFCFLKFCLLPYFLTGIAVLSFRATNKYIVDKNSSFFITNDTWDKPVTGGDTIFILSGRKKALKFCEISGKKNNPVVIINAGGQVQI